jgi:lipoyl(octanoyl) transferase
LNRQLLQVDLGLIGYAEACELQKRIVEARKASLVCARDKGAIEDVLLLCEHPHVITQGRNGKPEHLLASEHVLRQKGVEFFETSRGGDITYHGRGQIVGYPILNLGAIRRDVVWYVRMLEEAMIRATGEFGIVAERETGKTGVWVKPPSPEETKRESLFCGDPLGMAAKEGVSEAVAEKLGAIGVHISRWVTSHGFAYNVSTDLRYFDWIVPCGIAGRKATSLEKLLGRSVALEDVKPMLARYVAEVFGLELRECSPKELLERLKNREATERPPAGATKEGEIQRNESTQAGVPVLLEKE